MGSDPSIPLAQGGVALMKSFFLWGVTPFLFFRPRGNSHFGGRPHRYLTKNTMSFRGLGKWGRFVFKSKMTPPINTRHDRSMSWIHTRPLLTHARTCKPRSMPPKIHLALSDMLALMTSTIYRVRYAYSVPWLSSIQIRSCHSYRVQVLDA